MAVRRLASGLQALGRVHDLLLQTKWTSAPLATILKDAVAPFDGGTTRRFFIQSSEIEVGAGAVLPLAMFSTNFARTQ
jgi:two-component sensor histidine kinase